MENVFKNVFISTFIVFFIEALFHYNVGKNGLKTFILPKKNDFIKILAILLIFSFFNVFIFDKLHKKDNEIN
jgi:hypothetical protein